MCNGIKVDTVWCGNVLVADDITLLSCQSSGLQLMLNSIEAYSKKWRFEFNPGKTVEITFGESTKAYKLVKNKRKWILNGCSIKIEKDCEHVGMILTNDFSNMEQCQVAAKKGREVVSSMLSCGVRPGGLSPICGVHLWRTVGLTAMLYGSELWSNLKQSDLKLLDLTNRFAAKRMQGSPPCTRSEAATGNIGLWTISGHIDKMKLAFLHKMMFSPPSSVHKAMFINRLFSYIYSVVEKPCGFIPDVVQLLVKYELVYLLEDYINEGWVPSHEVWKKLISEKMNDHQTNIWKAGIGEKCTLCKKQLEDIAMHFIISCTHTEFPREAMIGLILDTLDVQDSAELFNLDDLDFYRSILSGNLSNFKGKDSEYTDIFVITVSIGILKIVKNVYEYITLYSDNH